MYEDEEFRNEELSSWMKPGDEIKNYDDLNHTYTKDLNDTFEFVYNWRQMIDEYRIEKGLKSF